MKVCIRCEKEREDSEYELGRRVCDFCRGRKVIDQTLRGKMYELLKGTKQRFTVEHLADRFDVAPIRIRDTAEELREQGYEIDVDLDTVSLEMRVLRPEPIEIDVSRFKGRNLRFGVTGDNHLGSKYERLDVLEALFDLWQEEGIDTVLQCGNMIDGEARFNKFDIHQIGVEAQVDYFVKHWPQRPGMRTLFITGDDHEGWYTQKEGLNVGRMIESRAREAEREDLLFLGHMEADLHLHAVHGDPESPRAIMRLIHGGGGTAYAISYKDQKIVESYQGGEKPHILLTGHFHKFNFGYPREVYSVQVGCTQDQTPFMRKLHIQAMLGGVSINFDQSPDGLIHNFAAKWNPFYDRSFYESKQWKYQWPNMGDMRGNLTV